MSSVADNQKNKIGKCDGDKPPCYKSLTTDQESTRKAQGYQKRFKVCCCLKLYNYILKGKTSLTDIELTKYYLFLQAL